MKNAMSKMFKFTSHFSSFLIIGASVILYVIVSSLNIEGGIVEFFNDTTNIIWTCVLTSLTIILHQIIISSASDNAMNYGLETDEFKTADELNGRIINKIGSTYEDFIDFVKNLNEYEKRTTQTAFIQSLGKRSIEDLDKKELKEFKKLKPVVHDITNFLKPCYVETTKDGKISYDSSYSKEKNLTKRITKIVFPIIMAFITLGPMIFSVSNFGMACLNALTMCLGLLITFITVFIPIYLKFKNTIPKKVYNKYILTNTYTEKRGTIRLELEKLPEHKIEEPIKEEIKEEIKVTEPIKEEITNETIGEEPIQTT